MKCSCCDKQAQTLTAYTLQHPLTGKHEARICSRCSKALPLRATDPILHSNDGPLMFAGGVVRAIWRRAMSASLTGMPLPKREAANDADDREII